MLGDQVISTEPGIGKEWVTTGVTDDLHRLWVRPVGSDAIAFDLGHYDRVWFRATMRFHIGEQTFFGLHFALAVLTLS